MNQMLVLEQRLFNFGCVLLQIKARLRGRDRGEGKQDYDSKQEKSLGVKLRKGKVQVQGQRQFDLLFGVEKKVRGGFNAGVGVGVGVLFINIPIQIPYPYYNVIDIYICVSLQFKGNVDLQQRYRVRPLKILFIISILHGRKVKKKRNKRPK
eukprot:TRINITY_DN7482_c0_g2_i1.p3 TRINITY_DN7482_c0_g2~~TRINITY_DN7482_c0_g2_i1.p3  ORF type:complete len:152 (-),score=12.87 TRINITY_DN7482_c0_g2_i1:368-823(-)